MASCAWRLTSCGHNNPPCLFQKRCSTRGQFVVMDKTYSEQLSVDPGLQVSKAGKQKFLPRAWQKSSLCSNSALTKNKNKNNKNHSCFRKALRPAPKISSVIERPRLNNLNLATPVKGCGQKAALQTMNNFQGKERKERVKLKETLVGQNETSSRPFWANRVVLVSQQEHSCVQWDSVNVVSNWLAS